MSLQHNEFLIRTCGIRIVSAFYSESLNFSSSNRNTAPELSWKARGLFSPTNKFCLVIRGPHIPCYLSAWWVAKMRSICVDLVQVGSVWQDLADLTWLLSGAWEDCLSNGQVIANSNSNNATAILGQEQNLGGNDGMLSLLCQSEQC